MDFKQKFEPKGKRVIHGAGQSPEQFRKYWGAVGKNKPAVYMTYIRVNEIKNKFSININEMLKFSKGLIPQIGLNLKVKNEGSKCLEVSKGEYDNELRVLCKILKKLKNPVFLRIGYEFNNPTHNYNPKEFILAWKHIVKLFRKNKVDNVAFVWCCCSAFNRNIDEIMSYYPGNDLFGVQHFKDNKNKVTEDFCREAEKHRKPLMICESSAAKVGVLEGEKSWNGWFKPYFTWIKCHEVVKAFCYINRNWGIDWKQPEWGNCRIEENEIVKKNYARELNNPIYLHYESIKELK